MTVRLRENCRSQPAVVLSNKIVYTNCDCIDEKAVSQHMTDAPRTTRFFSAFEFLVPGSRQPTTTSFDRRSVLSAVSRKSSRTNLCTLCGFVPQPVCCIRQSNSKYPCTKVPDVRQTVGAVAVPVHSVDRHVQEQQRKLSSCLRIVRVALQK